jgi:hypothetical protein
MDCKDDNHRCQQKKQPGFASSQSRKAVTRQADLTKVRQNDTAWPASDLPSRPPAKMAPQIAHDLSIFGGGRISSQRELYRNCVARNSVGRAGSKRTISRGATA